MPFFKFFIMTMFVLSLSPTSQASKTFCSMTLNSSDEKNVFEKHLKKEGFNFVELVPDSKDPSWFKKACDSQLQCDVLLISGHFGGLFFGQGTSTTIGLSELESASCQNSCPGILSHPKEVFLLGCNTLATQKKDHRTYSDYLHVLLEDGIPLDFAEQVVSSRYSGQGFTLEKKFAAVFPKAEKLYGFSSTGPLGAAAAPMIERYLEKVGPYSDHLNSIGKKNNLQLADAFRGTNYQETNPSFALNQDDRELFCALRSSAKTVVEKALEVVVRKNKLIEFFDSVAQAATSTFGVSGNFSDLVMTANIQKSLAQISRNNPDFVTIQHQVIKVSAALGIITQQQRLTRVENLLKNVFGQSLDYAKISQVCDILSTETGTEPLDQKVLTELTQKSAFFMLALNCTKQMSAETKKFLLSKITTPKSEAELTIALQIMKAHWTTDDRSWLVNTMQAGSSNLSARLYLSARNILYIDRSRFLSQPGIASCVLDSENKKGLSEGTNWGCLTDNPDDLSADVCDHFARLNPDPENADDMRWYCWSNNKQRFLNSRPECFLLAESMGILGNKMKQVWNCAHR